MSAFAHRGVVEGYYGAAFSHAERLQLVEEIGGWGMNRYLYAPKDDPLHRERWRDAYPRETLEQFAELIRCGDAAGVRTGFAISPGLSIRYSQRDDVKVLIEKFQVFQRLGSRFFALALDDVPSTLQHPADREAFSSLAAAHVSIAHAVRDVLGSEATLWLIPTDYVGTESSEYLETLGASLDPTIEVGWTGRTVISPQITRREAEARAHALRRKLLVWDNVPVNDGPMRPMLHLGPFAGRDPQLSDHLSGFMLNPMELPRASRLCLRTAADYLNDPEAFDREASWERAARDLGAGAPEAFTLFSRAHRFSALLPRDRDIELEGLFEDLCAAHAGEVVDEATGETDDAPLLRKLGAQLATRLQAVARIRDSLADRTLASEIEPWLEAYAVECQRMQIAVDLLESDSQPNDMDRVLAYFRFEGRLTHITLPRQASFGPRRVLYPQLRSHEDQAARFAADEALFLDCSLADAIVGYAERRACKRLGAKIRTGS
jgi:hyaluronoglucosaminidase